MIFVTPGTFSKSDATHQKQPPARVATFKLVGSSFIGLFTSCFLSLSLRPAQREYQRKQDDKDFEGTPRSRFTLGSDRVRGKWHYVNKQYKTTQVDRSTYCFFKQIQMTNEVLWCPGNLRRSAF